MSRRTLTLVFLIAAAFALPAFAKAETKVVPVPVGAGSYASDLPPEVNPKVRDFADRRTIYVTPGETRPIPTNSWWTYLLVHPYGGNLWAYPVTLKPDDAGFSFFYPTEWAGRDMQPDHPIRVKADGFNPQPTLARDWSDWSVTMLMADGAKSMTTTIGHGFPFAWTETAGVAPRLEFDEPVTFFDDAGAAVPPPAAADHLGVLYHDRAYAVFAPAGTRFTRDGNALTLHTPDRSFFVLAALPKKSDLALFEKYAFAVPRKTRVAWQYSPEKAAVDVTFTVTTENLRREPNLQTLQGFIPHHYKRARHTPEFGALEYAVVNGRMKCAVGNSFAFSYAFNGILPHMPAPADTAGPNPYRPERLHELLATYTRDHAKYGSDTYWGGKDLVNFPEFAFIARQTGDPTFEALKKRGHDALADWLTYTPGEKEHYFARYPRWHALIGFSPSFGSEEFTDNHFHYGYFTHAGALQSMIDPAFLKDFGPMLRLVAKQYANWDRADGDFPFLRTFDVWNGHSFAGGTASANGNNQESTSEAAQSWAGLFLLGSALGDTAMRDAGAFGFNYETRATREYWLDVDRENLPPSYGHSSVGVVWNGGLMYGTFFSAAPQHVHGIQWLPIAPYLSYLAQDPQYAAADYAVVLKEAKTSEVSSFGPDWANVALSYQQLYDPAAAARAFDRYWDANEKLARTQDIAVLTYYFTHSHRTLGELQWDCHISPPTSATYRDPRTGQYTYVACNPSDAPQVCTVYERGVVKGTFTAPPHVLAAAHDLQGAKR